MKMNRYRSCTSQLGMIALNVREEHGPTWLGASAKSGMAIVMAATMAQPKRADQSTE